MKVTQILREGMMKKVKDIADEVINKFADEKHFNHNAIVSKSRELLMKDPEFKDNPAKIKAALKAISDYVK